MQPSPISPTAAQHVSPPGVTPPASQLADRAYQVLTVIAMLLLLASVWLFW